MKGVGWLCDNGASQKVEEGWKIKVCVIPFKALVLSEAALSQEEFSLPAN